LAIRAIPLERAICPCYIGLPGGLTAAAQPVIAGIAFLKPVNPGKHKAPCHIIPKFFEPLDLFNNPVGADQRSDETSFGLKSAVCP
jgi:hypothetical protein